MMKETHGWICVSHLICLLCFPLLLFVVLDFVQSRYRGIGEKERMVVVVVVVVVGGNKGNYVNSPASLIGRI